MKDRLISEVGRQLAIPKLIGENRTSHVIYSLAGKMAIVSLWDGADGSPYISLQHFKRRVGEIFEAYLNVFPQVRHYFPEDKADLLDEIYAVYLRNGFFYHTSGRIYPCSYTESKQGNIAFCRGFAPGVELRMSGLGFYSLGQSTPTVSFQRMFGMQEQPMHEYLTELLDEPEEWTPVQWPPSMRFLRLKPPFTNGYWQEKPYKDGRTGLAYFGETERVYVFYRYENGRPLQRVIPEWQIKDFRSDSQGKHRDLTGYRRIASALLNSYGVLPPIQAKWQGEVVELKLGYLLPPGEDDFFKLFSWPRGYLHYSLSFGGYMATPVFLAFKQHLETIGYRFEEG